MRIVTVYFLISFLVIPACSWHRRVSFSDKKKQHSISNIALESYLYDDLPLPLQLTIESESSKIDMLPDAGVIVGIVDQSMRDIVSFYQRSMEWHGWTDKAPVEYESSTILNFGKKDRWCLIVLETIKNKQKQKTHFSMYFG
jgi:hypothetical protein